VLTSGQDAVVTQTVADVTGHYSVTPQLALNSWYFSLLLVICLTPMLASLLIGVEQEVPAVAEPAVTIRRFRPQYRRIAPIALTVTASIFAVALVLQMSTNAAFAASIKNSANTAGTRTWFTCQNAETGTTGAQFVWGLTATGDQTDLTGNGDTGKVTTAGTAATVSTNSPCPRDTQGSLMFNGGTCLFTNANEKVTGTETYSEEVWFQTTNSPLSGKLMGFASNSNPATGNQKDYDRHIYIDPTGRVLFGVESAAGAQTLVSSPAGTKYDDGAWHHVVATSAPGTPGTISLYLDDAPAVTRSVAGQHLYKGDWMVGCGVLAGWPDAATGTAQSYPSYPSYYTGNLRLAAVYNRTLTAAEVKEHYLAGTA